MTESSSRGDGFLADLCEAWENEVQRAVEFSVRPVSLRLGVVLGSDGGALSKMLPPFRMGLGGRLGHGRQWMSWIHVQDLAGIILHAIEQTELMGPVNAVAPNPVSNAEFTQTLGKVLHRPTDSSRACLCNKTGFGRYGADITFRAKGFIEEGRGLWLQF